MITETVKIYCENTNSHLFVQQGTSLMQVAEMLSIPTHPYAPLLACYVNNRLRELNFKIYTPLTLRDSTARSKAWRTSRTKSWAE